MAKTSSPKRKLNQNLHLLRLSRVVEEERENKVYTQRKGTVRRYRTRNNQTVQPGKDTKLLAKLPTLPNTNLIVRTPFKIISSIKEFKKCLKQVRKFKTFCFDYEATGFQWYKEEVKPTVLSISYKPGYSEVLPLFHFDSPFTPRQIKRKIVPELAKIFADKYITKIAHNLKYDLHLTQNLGIDEFDGPFKDTMLFHHLLDENSKHGLKFVGPNYFSLFFGWEKELDEYRKKNKYSWSTVPLAPLCCYAAQDTDITLRLCRKLEKELADEERLQHLYTNLVLPVFWELLKAERTGFKVDIPKLHASIEETKSILQSKMDKFHDLKHVKRFIKGRNKELLKQEIDFCKQKIETLKTETGKQRYRDKIEQIKQGELKHIYTTVNVHSNIDCPELLYNKKYGLGLPPKKVREKGVLVEKRTTNKDYLNELIPNDTTGVLRLIIEIRSINNMLSTYMVGILNQLCKDNKVHASMKQHGTVSGRLSMSEPNLQNQPVRSKINDEEATKVIKMIRKFYVPLFEDHVLLKLDYSQFEIRIMAEFAKDKQMIKAYKEGVDIHALTASSMLRISLEDFYKLPKPEQKLARFRAKAVNFGFLYGMGAIKFKDYALIEYNWDITLEEAEEYRNAYFKLYPGILPYHEKIIKKARKQGYVSTLFGRKRTLNHINDEDNFLLKISDEHAALNSPVQGTAAELTLLAIVEISKILNPKKEFFINTVHDSVLLSVPRKKVLKIARKIKHIAENLPIKELFNVKLKYVKLKVDIEIGENWGELEEIDLAA